jgi:hypothetical protein
MATLSDEHLRALRFLARHPYGVTEATLLKQGFTAGQLGWLVYAGLAKLRRVGSTTMKTMPPFWRSSISTSGALKEGAGLLQ